MQASAVPAVAIVFNLYVRVILPVLRTVSGALPGYRMPQQSRDRRRAPGLRVLGGVGRVGKLGWTMSPQRRPMARQKIVRTRHTRRDCLTCSVRNKNMRPAAHCRSTKTHRKAGLGRILRPSRQFEPRPQHESVRHRCSRSLRSRLPRGCAMASI
eukprot:SAG11_NODE_1672_length_4483_cov_3.470119_5_plen_155_part_00